MRVKKQTTANLVSLYAQAAQGYEDEIMEGTTRGANRQHGIAQRIFTELKERGEEKELLALLTDERPAVRLWAALHALHFAPEEGLRVLEDLAETAMGMPGAHAELGLHLYREGKLPQR